MKKIAYLLMDDGEERPIISYAFWDEVERDKKHENMGVNKNFLRKDEIIVDYEKRRAEALVKLDGLDRLLLEVK